MHVDGKLLGVAVISVLFFALFLAANVLFASDSKFYHLFHGSREFPNSDTSPNDAINNHSLFREV